MNKIIFIMIAFIAGVCVGNTGKPHVVDRYAIEYHHAATKQYINDIGKPPALRDYKEFYAYVEKNNDVPEWMK